MSRLKLSMSEPEIITPDAQLRLVELNAKHEVEAAQLAQLESIAKLMDTQFNVPLLPIPIGLDFLIGLIPGIGDTISLGVAGSIVYGSKRMGVGKRHMGRMTFNIFIDWLIGLVPVIGDLFDIGWRGNIRNVRIAREALERRWAQEREAAMRD